LSLQTGFEFVIGDNPFHGISHLSQAKSRSRDGGVLVPKTGAAIVKSALTNGAGGFMFSVSDITLSILKELGGDGHSIPCNLYPIIPYAYEQAREAVAKGTEGLASSMFRRIVFSGNIASAMPALYGAVRGEIGGILSGYTRYELERVKSAKPSRSEVKSILLHEVVTDMALALGAKSLLRGHFDTTSSLGVRPGFETRNFHRLIRMLREMGIPLAEVTVAAPFNSVGYQMSPDRSDCETELAALPTGNVFAFSVLAGGYLTLKDARDYIHLTPNLKGVAIGASSVSQAEETFAYLSGRNHHERS
jgi:hypothetical protein